MVFLFAKFKDFYLQLMETSLNGPPGAHAQGHVDGGLCIAQDHAATLSRNTVASSALVTMKRVGHATKDLVVRGDFVSLFLRKSLCHC